MSWPLVPFEEIIADCAYGPRFSSDSYDEFGNVATLRTTDLSPDGVISLDSMPLAKIDEDKFEGHFLKVGDLVISRSGRIGTTAVFNGYSKPVLPGAFLLRFRLNISKAHPLFYRIFFNSCEGQQLLQSVSQGAAQQNINITNVKKLKVPLPTPGEQYQIASVVACYDDLIATNRRQVELLEQAARLIYTVWFVRLRPRINTTNWCRSTLKETVWINPRTPSEAGEDAPFVPMTSLSQTGMVIERVERRAIGGGAKFQNGDTLLARITPCLENGKTGFVQFLDDENPVASGSTEFIVLRSRRVNPYWVYCLARTEHFREFAIRSMSGADGRQRVSTDSLAQYPVTIPPAEILENFEKAVGPMFEQIHTLTQQIAKLRQARDLLLPRLISGQLRL